MKKDGAYSGAFLPGKAALIVITVTAVTTGFALGYFVGRSVSSFGPSILKQSASSDLASVPAAPSSSSEPQNEASSSLQTSPPESTQASVSPSLHGATPLTADMKNDEKMTSKSQKAAMTEKKVIPGSGEESIPSAGVSNQDKGARSISDPEGTARDTPSQSADSSNKKVVYTVQAAAFKHQKDAYALKQTLEDKGYKVSIRKEPVQKGVVLFKVRVGEFEQKKDASVFALKLKKTDGLNAFAVQIN